MTSQQNSAGVVSGLINTEGDNIQPKATSTSRAASSSITPSIPKSTTVDDGKLSDSHTGDIEMAEIGPPVDVEEAILVQPSPVEQSASENDSYEPCLHQISDIGKTQDAGDEQGEVLSPVYPLGRERSETETLAGFGRGPI